MPSVTVAPRSLEAFDSVSRLNGSRVTCGRLVRGKRNIATFPFSKYSFRVKRAEPAFPRWGQVAIRGGLAYPVGTVLGTWVNAYSRGSTKHAQPKIGYWHCQTSATGRTQQTQRQSAIW